MFSGDESLQLTKVNSPVRTMPYRTFVFDSDQLWGFVSDSGVFRDEPGKSTVFNDVHEADPRRLMPVGKLEELRESVRADTADRAVFENENGFCFGIIQ